MLAKFCRELEFPNLNKNMIRILGSKIAIFQLILISTTFLFATTALNTRLMPLFPGQVSRYQKGKTTTALK